jgi:hypothetical protein
VGPNSARCANQKTILRIRIGFDSVGQTDIALIGFELYSSICAVITVQYIPLLILIVSSNHHFLGSGLRFHHLRPSDLSKTMKKVNSIIPGLSLDATNDLLWQEKNYVRTNQEKQMEVIEYLRSLSRDQTVNLDFNVKENFDR